MELPMGHTRKVKEVLWAYVQNVLGCDLLDKILTLDPSARIDADAALTHDFFYTDPMPCDLTKMLSHHFQSMFEYLAPPKQNLQGFRPPYQQMYANQNRSQDNSYQDRIY